MWLSKKKYYNLLKSAEALLAKNKTLEKSLASINRKNNIPYDKEYSEKHLRLERMIWECERIKKEIKIVYSTIKQPLPDEEVALWSEITNILNNRYFNWFVFQLRENIIKTLSGNPERGTGSIEAIDLLLTEMKRMEIKYKQLLEAENEQNPDNN